MFHQHIAFDRASKGLNRIGRGLCSGALLTVLFSCGSKQTDDTGTQTSPPDEQSDAGSKPTAPTPPSPRVVDAGPTSPQPAQSVPEHSDAGAEPTTVPTNSPTPSATETTPEVPTPSVQPTPQPTATDPSPEAGAPAPSPASAQWVYLETAGGYVLDAVDPTLRIGPLATLPSEDSTPWSKDGHWLADVGNETLSFFDLSQGGKAGASVTLPGTGQLFNWLGSVGALVSVTSAEDGSSLVLVTIDGQVVPLTEPSATSGVATVAASHDGRFVLYATSEMGMFSLYALDLQDPMMPSAPKHLVDSSTAPPLSFYWSNDSKWLAFGIPGAVNPIFLWYASLDSEATPVSPDGGSYTPLYSFAPPSNAFVQQTSNGDNTLLWLVTLADGSPSGTIGAGVAVDQGASVSPADWSPGGDYLLYSADTSWLHPVVNGVLGDRVEVTDREYSCRFVWLDDETFAYDACSAVPRELRVGTTADIAAAMPIHTGDFTDFAAGGTCIAAWSDASIRVGPVSRVDTEVNLQSPAAVSQLFVRPDGTGLVWTAGDTIYWQALSDCAPAGDVVSAALDGTTINMRLLPE